MPNFVYILYGMMFGLVVFRMAERLFIMLKSMNTSTLLFVC
ncbi:hypothetical protein PHMEG_0007856 [Phytophthora megakarya]|uniref:Uncharacterized protein n=1 Tax=Phytophthora megakarya TaxID=4795 RepID=A0A225WK43_9STRA|nr:hypothetical protein PHMEG_0007856 [Phytophthora megakarya]